MRLKCVESGHRLFQKMLLRLIQWSSGTDAPSDIIRTLFYRPEFFGKSFSAYVQESMRGPSSFSAGERELFAAFVSHKNQCVF